MKKLLHIKLIIFFILCSTLIVFACKISFNGKNQTRELNQTSENKRWSVSKADNWYAQQKWLIGCNFIPSTAINTLEMWQENTFDPKTIDKELGWAQSIGFNSVRVFLHYLLWGQDSIGFEKRLDHYLDIASKHKISTMFVLFDDCWNGSPKLGKQPTPIPGVHNSGWVQCPGQKEVTDTTLYPVFERYIKGVISHFKNDKRILMWDLYNEPGNSDHGIETLPLLKKVFLWARDAKPSQPITADYWNSSKEFHELNQFQLENSDIITFHNYENKENMKSMIEKLREYDRPLICTEYMRRPISTFGEILPLLKKENIGAYNWGLVSGKTQTIYPWDSWKKPYKNKPKIWFHDIFRKDGSPYDKSEIELIKSLTFVSIKDINNIEGKNRFLDYWSNPVLKPGKEGEWDAGALGSMTVVKAKGVFHMYYEAWGKRSEKNWDASEYNTLQIGHAVSLDGIHWKKDPANPVLPKGKAGQWDHDGTWDPYVIYENGKFKMWYGGGNKLCNWGHAVSVDGSHFKKEGKISDLVAIEDDHVIHDKKKNFYYMFYWNRKFEPDGLFRASSGNEKDFNFKDAVHIRIKGEKYPGMYKFTNVIKEGDAWYMFYANFERPHCSNSITRMAVSNDGLNWTKVNSDILHGQDAELLKIYDDLYLMYYGPSGYFDAKNCDIRAAIYNGKLKDLIRK